MSLSIFHLRTQVDADETVIQTCNTQKAWFKSCSLIAMPCHCGYGFLTTTSNEIVKPIHEKAMPAILTTPAVVDLWLTGVWADVKHLRRPLPGNMLVLVEPPANPKDDDLLL